MHTYSKSHEQHQIDYCFLFSFLQYLPFVPSHVSSPSSVIAWFSPSDERLVSMPWKTKSIRESNENCFPNCKKKNHQQDIVSWSCTCYNENYYKAFHQFNGASSFVFSSPQARQLNKKNIILFQEKSPDINIPLTRRRIAGEFWLCNKWKIQYELYYTCRLKKKKLYHRYSNSCIRLSKKFVSIEYCCKRSIHNLWGHWRIG